MVGGVKMLGGHDKGDSPGRKFVESDPDAGFDKQAAVGTVKKDSFLAQTVVDRHGEAAGDGHDEFLGPKMGMAPATFPSGDVVDMKYPPKGEGKRGATLHDREVAPPRGVIAIEFYQETIIDGVLRKRHSRKYNLQGRRQ